MLFACSTNFLKGWFCRRLFSRQIGQTDFLRKHVHNDHFIKGLLFTVFLYSNHLSITTMFLWSCYVMYSLFKVAVVYRLDCNGLRKNIFACLFSVHNAVSLLRHEQVCLTRLCFERYFSDHHRAPGCLKYLYIHKQSDVYNNNSRGKGCFGYSQIFKWTKFR